ncbi:putative bifunctional diguanylate cyclase/phosphodiesterase [Devosia sp. SL43]|uniref:putative bifunctional diguanylate cyclase/phosphodiesterase n=1 Tax=Devosia sp. SL43 TaxID=2806348 RepID=UPI001F3419CB|nr:EAL domain-containing protein [Devosia sp. SL43]UJW85546.1 EAL domain-containing protein [Devosia sp. SL43]
MSAVKSVLRFFAVPEDPELVLAQARALSRQIPLLYAMLLANTFILAATHLHTAPAMLTAYVPALLTVISVARLTFWWRGRNVILSLEKARRTLTVLLVVAAVLAIGFTTWSLSLFQYGDAYQRSHVAFYMGITSIGCMFCLMHARGAALIVAICVMGPFLVMFATAGQQTFMAIAINMVLVLAALIFIMLNNYRDFSALVASRSEMVRKQVETQRLSDENYRLANVDSLTNLPNRRRFEQHLREALARAQADGSQIAVARLDLDSFKSINDIFGQIAGDQVLIEVGHRINALRRPSTFVARLGSDQFALVLDGANDEASLQACGDVLTAAMRPSFETKLGTVHLSASAGFALSRAGDTADTLYDRADYVTWVAKRETRGRAVVFSDRHADELNRVRRMEHALHTANLDAELYILFQPQFDIASNGTTGYEVLARWRSPVLGEVSPAEFIPLAERTGTISKITQTVLRKALAVSGRLPKPLRLSVNLSAHDLGSATAIEAIAALVAQAGKPCRIDFEITETAVMRDMDQANQALLALLALGSRIALDDFGTGHSSLTHVQKLPLDRIKVDRSFVAEVSNDPTSRAIIKTTIDLCRNLGISCVFEGIETEEQLEALIGLGGTVMQGYLFGRPMNEELALKHLDNERQDWGGGRSRMFGAVS